MESGYEKACAESELSEGKTKIVIINGEPVILAKYNSQLFAIEGYCSHDGGEFEAEDKLCCEGQIECPRHGGRFDIETGEATRMPAIAPIATYNVKTENGEIFVSLDEK